MTWMTEDLHRHLTGKMEMMRWGVRFVGQHALTSDAEPNAPSLQCSWATKHHLPQSGASSRRKWFFLAHLWHWFNRQKRPNGSAVSAAAAVCMKCCSRRTERWWCSWWGWFCWVFKFFSKFSKFSKLQLNRKLSFFHMWNALRQFSNKEKRGITQTSRYKCVFPYLQEGIMTRAVFPALSWKLHKQFFLSVMLIMNQSMVSLLLLIHVAELLHLFSCPVF